MTIEFATFPGVATNLHTPLSTDTRPSALPSIVFQSPVSFPRSLFSHAMLPTTSYLSILTYTNRNNDKHDTVSPFKNISPFDDNNAVEIQPRE